MSRRQAPFWSATSGLSGAGGDGGAGGESGGGAMLLTRLTRTVTDVPAASAFLERYFGLVRTGGNAGMAFMTDDDGFVLSLMKGRADSVNYPGTFHIGFFVASEEQVDAVN